MIRRIDVNGEAAPMRVLFIPKDDISPNFPIVKVDQHLIEFYDSRYPHTPDGQFISRYYVSTFLESRSGVGLDLQGYVPDWKIDWKTKSLIRDWVTYHLYDEEWGNV